MNNKQTVHFIGIGGAGMSGLAEVFLSHGYHVQGSDIKDTKTTQRLEQKGIHIEYFHSEENIKNVDMIVYSSCIKEDNPELQRAKRDRIRVLRRMEALNMLLENKDIIAVSGAHGKTTVTALISYILINAGLDPTVFIGADVHFLEGNARYGRGDIVVTEADESDGSFLLLAPLYSVLTNIDKEHMDYYSSMDNLIHAYKRFIENTKKEGCAFLCFDDAYLKSIAQLRRGKIIGYGLCRDAHIRAEDVRLMGLDGSSFSVVYKGRDLGRLSISIIGMHNVLNILPAIGITLDLGIDFSLIQKCIRDFKGADRRFKVTSLDSDILVIDDYAHHPTEIEATLKVLEDSGRRIVTVFQPHRYSRTKYLKEQFGSCFRACDHLVITDIYDAFEEPIDGVRAQDLCESVQKRGHKNVNFVLKDDIVKYLIDIVRPGDAVFILGAGDIGELPEKIVSILGAQER